MLKWLLLGVLSVGVAGVGCVHRRPPDPLKAAAAAAGPALGDDFRATRRDDVPLYRSGPRQMSIPDTVLPKDTLVRVVRTQFGYSLVRTESGLLGWVASDDLGVTATPPPAVAAGDALPPSAAGGPPSPVNRIDALNARASGQNTLPVGAAPGSSPPETTNGDSAIVARYRIDAPAAGTTKAAPAPAPARTPAGAAAKPAPSASASPAPASEAAKAEPSPNPEATKAVSSPTPEPSP
jgi:hypothetical protein